jgi:hypothetical protein
MKPRDGDDSIRDSQSFGQKGHGPRAPGASARCPSCGAEIPSKPGFRLSALKCPKCGAPAVKK